jgi:hypothetical protein
MDILDDDSEYVCITHQCFLPCEKGDHHLVSNWIADVYRIRKSMEKK